MRILPEEPREASNAPADKSQQGSVPAVWGSVLGLALLVALDPVRLGLILLVISRPRPVQNLLAYWVGCLIANVPYMLVPLTLLHVTPMFRSFAHDLAAPATSASSTVRHIQIGIGVLALSIAALMTVRFWAASAGAAADTGRQHVDPGAGLEYTDRNLAAAGPRAGCADGGRICNPAAARPRPQCVGKRILVGRVGDRHRMRRRHPSRFYSYTPPSWPREPRSARRSAPPSRSSSGCLRLSRSPSSAIWPRQRKPKRYCDCCTTGRWLTVSKILVAMLRTWLGSRWWPRAWAASGAGG